MTQGRSDTTRTGNIVKTLRIEKKGNCFISKLKVTKTSLVVHGNKNHSSNHGSDIDGSNGMVTIQTRFSAGPNIKHESRLGQSDEEEASKIRQQQQQQQLQRQKQHLFHFKWNEKQASSVNKSTMVTTAVLSQVHQEKARTTGKYSTTTNKLQGPIEKKRKSRNKLMKNKLSCTSSLFTPTSSVIAANTPLFAYYATTNGYHHHKQCSQEEVVMVTSDCCKAEISTPVRQQLNHQLQQHQRSEEINNEPRHPLDQCAVRTSSCGTHVTANYSECDWVLRAFELRRQQESS